MRMTLAFMAAAVSSVAYAQPPQPAPPAPSTASERIASQIGTLVIQTENQRDVITSLQQQLTAARGELAKEKVKEKTETPADETPK